MRGSSAGQFRFSKQRPGQLWTNPRSYFSGWAHSAPADEGGWSSCRRRAANLGESQLLLPPHFSKERWLASTADLELDRFENFVDLSSPLPPLNCNSHCRKIWHKDFWTIALTMNHEEYVYGRQTEQ
jgi:hypothetical protein